MSPIDHDRALTTGQVAKYLKRNVKAVRKLFDTGQLKGFCIPGSTARRVTRECLIAYMRQNGISLGELDPQTQAAAIFDPLPQVDESSVDSVRNLVHALCGGFTYEHEAAKRIGIGKSS